MWTFFLILLTFDALNAKTLNIHLKVTKDVEKVCLVMLYISGFINYLRSVPDITKR